MKLMMLMYLEEDEACVNRLVAELGVPMVSQLGVEGMEGVGSGKAGGWYGESAPYQSRMTLTVVDDAMADRIVEAIGRCEGIVDPRHPIRVVQLAVERTTTCSGETKKS